MEGNTNNHSHQLVPISFPSGSMLDTRTGHLDDLLNEKLEQAFHKQTSSVMLHELVKIAIEHDPIDLAHAATRLPPSARPILYENLPDIQAKIIFMINASSNTRAAIYREIDDQEIVKLIEGMPPDEAVHVLDDLSNRRLKRVLDLLNPKKAKHIRELQMHDRNSAGRLMTNEFFAFKMHATIGEVAASIRDNPGIDLTRRIFVLNDAEQLVGYVPSRNLIVNPPYVPIRQVMQPILHMLTPNATRDEVVELMERYTITALPIVDEKDHLLGVVSFEDAVEAMKDIADETIASIAGTAEDVSENEPIVKRFFWRAPWLVVTLCAGLTTATAMAYFKTRAWFVFVPFFVPLIAGMSGNVGIQCSTIMVRSMANGELTLGSRRKAIGKELLIGLLIGAVFGLFCGVLVYILNRMGINLVGHAPWAISVIVSFGVLGACLTATLLGALSPFFFARFHIDPAVASGPIVTAFNDVLSTLMFFLVASSISYFFL